MISLESNKRRIASNYLLYRGELLRNGVVELDSVGRVLSVGSSESIDSLSNTEFFSGVMLPGLVNAHCHLELSYLRGAITEQCGFASFAQQLGAARNKFTAEEMLSAIKKADIQAENEGVVAVGDISNSALSFEIKERSRVHYHTFVEHFGLGRDSVNYLEGLLRGESYSLTPHSTYSVSDKCFRDIASRGEAPLSIHFMETASERELFEQRGEMWKWYSKVGFSCDFLGYGSPARRIVESVPRSRSVILVHNTAINEEDISLIMNHFTAPVYWVVSPRSNRYISGGEPPLGLMRHSGLNICVGTDSLASNYSLSMLDELRALDSAVPLAERLDWVSGVGAKALGCESLCSFEVGAKPTIITLSGVDVALGVVSDKGRINKIL